MTDRRRAGPLVLLLVLASASLAAAAPGLPQRWPSAPPVSAESYVLMDVATGHVLAAERADERRPVASTVKLLTALTVLAHASPQDTVEVGREIVGVGGASTGLRPGDRHTVEELLGALLVRSGNDAAVALAVHVGGSVEGFVALMVDRAEELGLQGLVLASPSGLDDRNRLSATQLAVIARAAHEQPTIRRLAAASSLVLGGRRVGGNRNLLLGTYDGATGLKTGYTDAAGWSVIGSAERRGRALVVVVLASDGPDARFDDAATLLDHGFSRFRTTPVELAVTLHTGGGEVRLTAGPEQVVVPADDATLTIGALVPVEVPDEVAPVPVSWQGEELTHLTVEIEDGRRPTPHGGAAIGRYLVDRLHAGVRGTLQRAPAATGAP